MLLAGGIPQWVFRLHVDLDLHSELVASIPVINARQWNCLIGSSRHSNSDKITIAYDAVCGIKFDPPGARHIDLTPGMGRPAPEPPRAIAVGNINVPSHKPGGESQRPRCFH